MREDSHIECFSVDRVVRSDTELLKKMFHMFSLFCLCWWSLIGKIQLYFYGLFTHPQLQSNKEATILRKKIIIINKKNLSLKQYTICTKNTFKILIAPFRDK